MRRPGLRLPRHSGQRQPRARGGVHEAGGLPDRQVHRRGAVPGRGSATARRRSRWPRSSRRSSRSSGSASGCGSCRPTRSSPDWCSVPSRKILTCGSGLAWLKDFPDPQPMLRAGLRRRRDRAEQQHQLLTAQRSRRSTRRWPRRVYLRGAARRRAWGAHRPHDRRSGGCRPVAMGREHADPLQGRRRRAQRLLRQLGPLLHVAEVGGMRTKGPAGSDGPFCTMRMRGLEPPRSHASLRPERSASPNSATSAERRSEHIAHGAALSVRTWHCCGRLATDPRSPSRHRLGD